METFAKMRPEEIRQLWTSLYEFFREAPAKYPVHKWRYGDLDMWPIIKGMILLRAVRIFNNRQFDLLFFDEAQSAANSIATPDHEPDAGGTLSRLLKSARSRQLGLAEINSTAEAELDARSRLISELPDNAADLLMFGAGISASRYGRFMVQQHLDPVRLAFRDERLSSYCYVLDLEEGGTPDLPFLVPGVGGFKKSFDRIQSGLQPKDAVDCSLFEGFTKFWQEGSSILFLDLLITKKLLSNVYRRTYSARRSLYQYFNFRQTKAVALFAYYGILGWAASAACRRLGIPLIDIQHGIAGPGHESYDFRHLRPQGYNTIPTHFFCWTREEADHLNAHANGAYEALHTGQSWKLISEIMTSENELFSTMGKRVEQARMSQLETRQQLSLSDTTFVNQNAGKDSFSILLALQNDSDLELAAQLVKAPKPNWKFYVRLHPGTVVKPEKFEPLVAQYDNAKCLVRLGSTTPLDLLLPKMDVVVTQYSSIVLDALAFGKPSLCYGEAAPWYFSMLGDRQPAYCDNNQLGMFLALLELWQRAERGENVMSPQTELPLMKAGVRKVAEGIAR